MRLRFRDFAAVRSIPPGRLQPDLSPRRRSELSLFRGSSDKRPNHMDTRRSAFPCLRVQEPGLADGEKAGVANRVLAGGCLRRRGSAAGERSDRHPGGISRCPVPDDSTSRIDKSAHCGNWSATRFETRPTSDRTSGWRTDSSTESPLSIPPTFSACSQVSCRPRRSSKPTRRGERHREVGCGPTRLACRPCDAELSHNDSRRNRALHEGMGFPGLIATSRRWLLVLVRLRAHVGGLGRGW